MRGGAKFQWIQGGWQKRVPGGQILSPHSFRICMPPPAINNDRSFMAIWGVRIWHGTLHTTLLPKKHMD